MARGGPACPSYPYQLRIPWPRPHPVWRPCRALPAGRLRTGRHAPQIRRHDRQYSTDCPQASPAKVVRRNCGCHQTARRAALAQIAAHGQGAGLDNGFEDTRHHGAYLQNRHPARAGDKKSGGSRRDAQHHEVSGHRYHTATDTGHFEDPLLPAPSHPRVHLCG